MDYKQEVRDVINLAVKHEIPIWQAADQIEAIIITHIEGE